MTRQRAQRLAMEWTVALTTMDIPDDLGRIAGPPSDDSLGDLRFRALLADDDGPRCRLRCAGGFPSVWPAAAPWSMPAKCWKRA